MQSKIQENIAKKNIYIMLFNLRKYVLVMTASNVLYIYAHIPTRIWQCLLCSPNLTSLPTDPKVRWKIEQLNIHAMFHFVTEKYMQS